MRTALIAKGNRWVDYYITDEGQIYSQSRKTGKKRYIKIRPNRGGYITAKLPYEAEGYKCKQYYVHQQVLMAFVGPRPGPNYDACHNDGDKNNNHISNLRWDTHRNNCLERETHRENN